VTQTQEYDAVIIGSGQGGGPLSTALARSRKTALIEREHIGGTCINEGCTPTKTMVASAEVAYVMRRSADYGVHGGPVSVNMAEVRERKRDMVTRFRTNSRRHIERGGVDIIDGEASFTGPSSLIVRRSDGEQTAIVASSIVINTGARPIDPPLPGLASVPYLNSTSIMELDEVPHHLLVLGGGYVSIEFGQMFRRFGSEVTIIERGPRLMGREDADICEELSRILSEDGIEILLKSPATCVEQSPDGAIRLALASQDGEQTVAGSHLLVAVGRSPNTEQLNLPAAGVECTERGFIKVNDRLETGVPGIYAMGDVAGSPAFTHMSYDDFRILRTNLLEGGNRSTKDRLVPYTLFTDPQLGRIGLTEDQARAQGRNIYVAKIPMSHVARAIELDEDRGLVKAAVDAETGQILGCSVLGMEGGEIMAMFEIAMIAKLPYTALRDAIFAHPTLAELLNTLFSSMEIDRQPQEAMSMIPGGTD
jgi:pyruvate/2-oxoglutarate dehydrogenase complex dihydrolipoamide dehydrogenase (E3) component